MPDYQKLYTAMFNAVTDALVELGHFNMGTARKILRTAQRKAEELYTGADGDAESVADEAEVNAAGMVAGGVEPAAEGSRVDAAGA